MPTLAEYVIVGAGSAGCAMAYRLAEAGKRVLVIEHGGTDRGPFIQMPAALSYPMNMSLYDWGYQSEPEPQLGGRQLATPRGKVIGGSSSINGMVYVRGHACDFDHWAESGADGWSFADVLPYFRRMENCLAGGDEWRGDEGPLEVERGPAGNPLFDAWLTAGSQAGFLRSDDVNGYRQEGFAVFDKNVRRGRRLSAARAYLHPVLDRPNLTLHTRAFVEGVEMDGARATGVRYRWRGRARTASSGEVILSGGAFNSPQLLQLSGIGDAGWLEGLGVPVVADLPGVGRNLQDHLEVYIQHACAQPVSMQPHLAQWRKPWIGLQWLFRRGPAATNHFEAGAFLCGNEDVESPNLMFHFLPLAIRYDGSQPSGGHGYQVHVGPMRSDSRGEVRIRSADPQQHPAITFNYLSTEQDRTEWLEAVRVARRILGQPAFAEFDAGEISPGPGVGSDEEILEWVARDSETALHPSGTARLGLGPEAVVDPRTFRVHGVDGLRVVDASLLPSITNANIYAPTMMIAERAADAVLGNSPLRPSGSTVYRGGT